MKEWAIYQFGVKVVDKIGDIIFAKKRAAERKKMAIIITVICVSVVLLVAAAVVVTVVVLKKKGKDVSLKSLIAKIKAKFHKEDELCEGFEESDCEEVEVAFE